jgi:enamine deaminase RidA (YjgF/YER057c/UK114 family)
MSVTKKLEEMGVILPEPLAPVAAYVPSVRSGDLVFVSGQVPFVAGELATKGRLGDEVDLETGRAAARAAVINCLAVLAGEVDLDRVRRIVKLTGYVACASDFEDQARVINGASEFILSVFGDAGRHARAAVGVAALPLGAPVEVELIAEVD